MGLHAARTLCSRLRAPQAQRLSDDQRLKRHPFLALFDGADPNASTAIRLGSTVPTQALYFLNDPFVHQASQTWSDRLVQHSSGSDRINLAYETALARQPTTEELQIALDF